MVNDIRCEERQNVRAAVRKAVPFVSGAAAGNQRGVVRHSGVTPPRARAQRVTIAVKTTVKV